MQECLNEHIRAMCEYVRQADTRTRAVGWEEGQPIPGFGPEKAVVRLQRAVSALRAHSGLAVLSAVPAASTGSRQT